MQNKRVPLLPGMQKQVPQMQETTINTNFGIAPDRQRVMLIFSQPVPNMILTVEKAQEWCTNIQGVIDAIKALPENANG